MFGAYSFGQGYFAQGPMSLSVPVDGPIHVDNVEQCRPEVRRATSKRDRTTGVRAKKPRVTNTESC